MNSIIKRIKQTQASPVKREINARLKEFQKIGKDKDKIFSELCFCLLTANFQAEKSWQMQRDLEHLFQVGDAPTLKLELRERGHRFWPQRAGRIIDAREHKEELAKIKKNKNELELRMWLVKNINGIGMKEASHFLNL